MKQPLDSPWQIKHPLRSALRAALGLSTLCCLAAPFADVPNGWVFALAGVGYSALLSFMTVGLCILPQHVRTPVLRGALIVQHAFFALSVAFVAYLYYSRHLPSLPYPAVIALPGLFLAGLAGFSARGWHLYCSGRCKPRS
jgi:hypothetical protein